MVGERVYCQMFAVCFVKGRSYVVDYAGGRIRVECYRFERERMEDWRIKNVEPRLLVC
jgi:hypothetical protein